MRASEPNGHRRHCEPAATSAWTSRWWATFDAPAVLHPETCSVAENTQ